MPLKSDISTEKVFSFTFGNIKDLVSSGVFFYFIYSIDQHNRKVEQQLDTIMLLLKTPQNGGSVSTPTGQWISGLENSAIVTGVGYGILSIVLGYSLYYTSCYIVANTKGISVFLGGISSVLSASGDALNGVVDGSRRLFDYTPDIKGNVVNTLTETQIEDVLVQKLGVVSNEVVKVVVFEKLNNAPDYLGGDVVEPVAEASAETIAALRDLFANFPIN
jgi:hypothetical protein